jgi:hypothetical protein
LRLIATQILEQNCHRKRCVTSPEIDMKNTTAKFVSAVFASIIASSSLLAAPEAEEKEKPTEKPDTCLLGPSASTPPGGHWYYRRDSANKRNCWYLGDAKGKSARKPVAEDDVAAAEKPAAPLPKKPATQRSVTDARAEFQPPQTSVEPPSKAATTPWPAVTPTDAQRADEPRKVVTTRWPELAAASPPSPAAAPPASSAQSQPQIAQAPQPQAPTQTAPVTPPPRSAAPPPAKANTAADQPLSMPMLLTVLVGGLSVLGVMGSAMFARGKSRGNANKSRPARRLSRTAPMPPLQPAEQPLPETRAPDDPNRRLQQMLAEIQRRAAA